MKKTKFLVTLVVEVEHKGDPFELRSQVEEAVTDMVDAQLHRHGGKFASHGVKIIDAFYFNVEVMG